VRSIFASNQIFKDLRGQTNDPCEKADLPPASKGVSDHGRTRRTVFQIAHNTEKTLCAHCSHDPGQFHRIRKTWEPERTSSEGGYRDFDNLPSLAASPPHARHTFPDVHRLMYQTLVPYASPPRRILGGGRSLSGFPRNRRCFNRLTTLGDTGLGAGQDLDAIRPKFSLYLPFNVEQLSAIQSRARPPKYARAANAIRERQLDR
jgi:hypothetical protein